MTVSVGSETEVEQVTRNKRSNLAGDFSAFANMELEHVIGLGVVVLFSSLAAWLVWSCMCKSDEDDNDVESQDEIKSVNSRTRVISAADIDDEMEIRHHQPFKEKYPGKEDQLQEVFITQPPNNKAKGKGKNSCYVQTSRQARFADPFGEWTRREKEIDDTEALSGIKSYRKSPVLPHRS